MPMKSPTLIPSLENLSYVLRHRELWPEGFRWYYPNPLTCGIGLAHRLWGEQTPVRELSHFVVKELFCSPTATRTVTRGWWIFKFKWLSHVSFYEITPEDVADRIDQYLGRDAGDRSMYIGFS